VDLLLPSFLKAQVSAALVAAAAAVAPSDRPGDPALAQVAGSACHRAPEGWAYGREREDPAQSRGLWGLDVLCPSPVLGDHLVHMFSAWCRAHWLQLSLG